jgi:ferredoxin
MAETKIAKKDIGGLLRNWSEQYAVLAPSNAGGQTCLAAWDGQNTDFIEWYRNTVVPARASFQPPYEELFSFTKGKDGYELKQPEPDEQPKLLFGVRPCDAAALAILDKVFTDTYQDPYYLARRKNILLVGLTCTDPYDTCFCTSLEGSPSQSANLDLLLTDIGDDFLIEAVSDAGRELLTGAAGITDAAEADEAKAKEVKEAAAAKITRRIDTGEIERKLVPGFDNKEFWEEVAAKCVSCGICTLLCPTCYCFDISDEKVKLSGTRYRSCDSCAFSVYTRMPAENPREEKWRRVRQKVAHKYAFYPMSFGEIACTGCGRCIRLCPVNWDITGVLSSLPEPQPAEVKE